MQQKRAKCEGCGALLSSHCLVECLCPGCCGEGEVVIPPTAMADAFRRALARAEEEEGSQ